MEYVIYIIIVAYFVLGFSKAIIDLIKDHKNAPICEHGVRNGKKKKRYGKYKCEQCQKERERIELEKTKQKELEAEHKRHAEEIQRKFSGYLRIALEARKNVLIKDEFQIRRLSPREFEDFIATLFRRKGYEVKQTSFVNDGGKDAFAYKDGQAFLIECKHYAENQTIGRPMLQKLFAAMNEEKIENGIFISTCGYSKTAKDYGRIHGIKTFDMYDILDMVEDVYDSEVDKNTYDISCRVCGDVTSFKLFSDSEYKTCSNGHVVPNVFWNTSAHEPICMNCGGKFHLVHGRNGNFYGCNNYPKCHAKMSKFDYEFKYGRTGPQILKM